MGLTSILSCFLASEALIRSAISLGPLSGCARRASRISSVLAPSVLAMMVLPFHQVYLRAGRRQAGPAGECTMGEEAVGVVPGSGIFPTRGDKDACDWRSCGHRVPCWWAQKDTEGKRWNSNPAGRARPAAVAITSSGAG